MNLMSNSPKTPTTPPTSETGVSGSQVKPFAARAPGTPPVVLKVPPPSVAGSSSGWKEPKSGWNESPPRQPVSNQPVQRIHATPNVTLARVTSDHVSTPPPVIRRDYSSGPPMPPIVHNYPPPIRPGGPPPVIHRVYNAPPPILPYQQPVAKTSSVILKREYDSDSDGEYFYTLQIHDTDQALPHHHRISTSENSTLGTRNYGRALLQSKSMQPWFSCTTYLVISSLVSSV